VGRTDPKFRKLAKCPSIHHNTERSIPSILLIYNEFLDRDTSPTKPEKDWSDHLTRSAAKNPGLKISEDLTKKIGVWIAAS